MTMRIAVFNQKGGVGKTTTVLSLASALHQSGQTPVAIDMDPQAHLSSVHGNALNGVERSMFSFFQQQTTLRAIEID